MSQDSQLHTMYIPLQWTAEQVFSLAPDENSRRVSRRMAGPEKWLMLGSASELMWGKFPTKDRPSIETVAHVADLAFTCSCGHKRSPCDHAISLLLMWVETPDAFQSTEPPNWARARLDSIPPLAQNSHHPSLPKTNADEPGTRQTALLRGLEDLELWLHDVARNGFADVQARPKASWAQIAERLVDAGASELAREVRRLADIPDGSSDWPERLLGRLGLLYLLIQGFKRLNSLPPESQADLRAAAGWPPRLDLSRPDMLLRDRWHVMSNQFAQEGRQRVQRTWLWGENHDRAALILRRSYKEATFDTRLITGTMVDADLNYFLSSTPIRAQVETLYERTQPDEPLGGYSSIEQAMAAYSEAISHNPWLGMFPVLLRAASVAPDRNGWTLHDRSGSLSLPSKYSHLWHLLALTVHGDAPVFGEWDGEALHPLSVWVGERWVELRSLQGTN